MREVLLLTLIIWAAIDFVYKFRNSREVGELSATIKLHESRLEDLQLELNRLQVESIIDQAEPRVGSYRSEI
jgi:hypothetical protein